MKKIIKWHFIILKLFLFPLFFVLTNVVGVAQCPLNISVTSTNVTAASCPSNGAFTINATVGTGATYQITSGPAGYPTAAQNSNTFSALLPGTYTVKVACQGNSAISTTTNIIIPSTYTQVAANSVVSNVCSGNAGTITTSATGSSTPFTYAYWQGDPAASDGTLTYGSTNTFIAPSTGTYNVRTKDACGIFVTQQVTVADPYPANLCITAIQLEFGNLSCAQLQNNIYARFYAGSTTFNSLPPAGIDLDVYENTGSCASPVQGALVSTQHYDNTSTDNRILIPNGKNLLFKIRTPCGTSCTYCHTYSPSTTPFVQNSSMVSSGCVPAGSPVTYSIKVNIVNYFVLPVTYIIKNSAGITVGTYTADGSNPNAHTFDNLPADTYTSTATDACGNTDVKTFTPPTGTENDLSLKDLATFQGCSSIEGRTTLRVEIEGVMANLTNATATIVAPSPSLIGVAGKISGPNKYDWINVIPGATYYIKVENGCGQSDVIAVDVPNKPNNILIQHTNATVQQLCGGAGNIIVNADYTGNGGFSYQIINSAGTVVATGAKPGGTYSNLPAGNYQIKSMVVGCEPDPYFYSSSVTITPGGVGPTVIKKLGIVCEDALGNPATTGNAILSFTGAKPLKLDYRLTSGVDADYINLSNDSDGTETITGLTAGTAYTVRITDACGNATITQITIGQLSPVKTENTANPCAASPYTLSVPDFVDATYEWKKSGAVISNQRTIIFNPYTAGDDGVYVCKIVIGGCVTRTVTTTLSSINCNIPLPVTLVNFTAKQQDAKVLLNWKTATEINSAYFEVQHSINAGNWINIGKVGAAGNSSLVNSYSFTHTNPAAKVNYYRLKMMDADSNFKYSDIRVVNIDKSATVNLFPNPVMETLYISGNTSLLTSVAVLSIDGKKLKEYKTLSAGSGIDMKNYQPGIYIIRITDVNGNTTSQKVVKK